MTALARRLDPCVNWFKLLARTQGRILWLFPALLLTAYLATLDWGGVGMNLRDRLGTVSVNSSLRAEARRLDLDFDRVVADPAAAVGKPVVWCVDSFDGRTGFVNGRQSELVVWTVPSPDELKSSPGVKGYCLKTLAVVTGVERGVPQLRLVEKL